MKAAIA